MNDKLFEVFKTIETLNSEELQKVTLWVEFNIEKRQSLNVDPENTVFFKNP